MQKSQQHWIPNQLQQKQTDSKSLTVQSIF